MALRAIDFTVPPPQRSIIEEAFGVALGTLAREFISEPFTARAERRQRQGQIDLTRDLRRQEFGLMKELLTARKEMGEFVEVTPELEQEFAAARRTPLLTTIDGKAHVSTEQVQTMRQGRQPVGGPARSIVDFIMDNIQQRQDRGRGARARGAAGAAAPVEETPPLTQAEFAEAKDVLQEGIQLHIGLLTDERQRDLRESGTAHVLAQLMQNIDPRDFAGFGTMDATTGKPRPLTLDEMSGYTNWSRLDPLIAVATGAVRQALVRLRDSGKRLEEQGLVRLPVLTPTFFDQALSAYRTLGTKQLDEKLATFSEFSRFGLIRELTSKGESKRITDAARQAAAFDRNLHLQQAAIASQFYRDMDEYEEGLRAGAMQLTPIALGYLQHLFKAAGIHSWKHERATNPAEMPPIEGTPQTPGVPTPTTPAGTTPSPATAPPTTQPSAPGPLPGVTPGIAQQITTPGVVLSPLGIPIRVDPPKPPAPPVQVGVDTTATDTTTLAGGRAPSVVDFAGSPSLQRLYAFFVQRLEQDTAAFDAYSRRIQEIHETPESAAQFYKGQGVSDLLIGRLETGPHQHRQVALNALRRNAEAALESARNDVIRLRARRARGQPRGQPQQ